MKLISKELLLHPVVLSSLGAVVVIAAGSAFYYTSTTRQPSTLPSSEASTTADVVTGSGTVEPAQNPNLAFVSGGRVAAVNATVGKTVAKGQLLASLDVGSLAAGRAQAAASVKAAQANLDKLQAGARDVDINAKQTALLQANTTLSNLYASIPAGIAQAYDKSFSGVSVSTDSLFNQPNGSSPTLAFLTTNSQTGADAVTKRITMQADLNTWQTEVNSFSLNSSTAAIDAELTASLVHLSMLRNYSDTLLQALSGAIPGGSFTQSSITTAQTTVGAFRDTINSLILAVQTAQQQAASDAVAVKSAQDALNQTLAGSTPQDIEAAEAAVEAAQAQVANFNAQISNATVVAPFAGTVASVHVKTGDIVSPNTAAVSLNPESALQVVVYFSEIDIAKIKTGQTAQVTLDAYGNGRTFPADVVTVDTSPTPTSGYKATLQFLTADPAITSGMTANVTIPINQ